MSLENTYLKAALRRLRLLAAVARAEQSGNFRAEDLSSLRGQLSAAMEAEREARAAGEGQLPIDRVTQRLSLRRLDEDVLLAAVALEADPLFALTLSALGGEEPRQGMSAKLLAQLFAFSGDEVLSLGIDPTHPLVEAALLESGWSSVGIVDTLRPWRAATRTVSFLAGEDELDSMLARCGGLVEVPEKPELSHVAPAGDVLEQVMDAGEDVIVLIEGPEGAGRRTLAAVVAAARGRQAVYIDAGRLSADPARCLAELRALRRECWLRGAVPIVARIDGLSRSLGARAPERFPDIADALESPGAPRGAAIITATVGADLPDFRRRVVRIRVDTPPPEVRERLWLSALGERPSAHEGSAAGSTLQHVAQRYRMTPGVIHRSSQNARMFARGRTLDVADVHAGVAAEIHERFGSLASRLKVQQRWDDLVLPADTLDEVKAFAGRAAHAARVYEDWGFRSKLQRGLGLSALFSGPPGTGKTMVASLIAGSLGLDLYMVDLAQVVSKWVGETEKQLSRIFDAASIGRALLLFDEADALFAKRTEVKSSNDRYANLEVNYLLQRLEDFGGVAILTTNLEASVDPAFKRRLAGEVKFYPPEVEERERLWRTLLPAAAPAEANLQFQVLAEQFKDMCGGHIRNAVLRAAFLAAAEERSITQEHLVRAARTEYRAMGKVV